MISATQSLLGASALKARSTRSGAWRPPSRTVVVTKRRRLTPAKLAAFINRAMRLRLTRRPLSTSSACTRGLPSGPVRGRVGIGADALDQRGVAYRARRRPLSRPRIVTAGGDAQHTAHGGDRKNGPVCAHENRTPRRNRFVSRANQAAAFERIALQPELLVLLAQPASSLRSACVRPSLRRPCVAIGLRDPVTDRLCRRLKLLASSSGDRPARTSSIIAAGTRADMGDVSLTSRNC